MTFLLLLCECQKVPRKLDGNQEPREKRMPLQSSSKINSPHSVYGFVFTDDCGLKAMFLSIVVALKPYSQRAALSQSRAARAPESIMIHLCACDLI